MDFVDWDRRPALLFSDDAPRMALAVLEPGANWSPVDFGDVWSTAGVMSETAWRERFEPKFGPLDVPAANALHSRREV